jgi:hypothetical protein
MNEKNQLFRKGETAAIISAARAKGTETQS